MVMDYLCAKFGDFSFSCFGFIMRTTSQNDRQNHTQRQMIATGYSRDYRRRATLIIIIIILVLLFYYFIIIIIIVVVVVVIFTTTFFIDFKKNYDR